MTHRIRQHQNRQVRDTNHTIEPIMATERRERKPSIGAPISELQRPVGPGFSRPKHKRTYTGFAPAEIKNIEASIPEPLREA